MLSIAFSPPWVPPLLAAFWHGGNDACVACGQYVGLESNDL
jgi:hypothetical protein